jgi:hypothetical protein
VVEGTTAWARFWSGCFQVSGATRQGFGQALLRGRYAAAVARMEHTGIPIDVPLLDMLRRHWGDIKLGLVADIDKDYGVYQGTTFKAGLFASWLDAEGIAWPRTSTGRLQLDQDTFHDMAKTFPKLAPLKELRHALSEMRLEEIAVGPDGRNRIMLSPFGARTGRNTRHKQHPPHPQRSHHPQSHFRRVDRRFNFRHLTISLLDAVDLALVVSPTSVAQ